MGKQELLAAIKELVLQQEPTAEIILYGSFARGDNKEDSDIDILILLDKENLSYNDSKRITYPLYDLEFKTGQLISPLIKSKTDWNRRHKVTPLFKNIKNEGIKL